MKKKKTARDIFVIILKIIGAIIANIIVHGFLIIAMGLPMVDYVDGYFNPGPILKILFVWYELLLLATQIDLILMTIHSFLEGIYERFLPKIYIGLPWNYFLKSFTIGMWNDDIGGNYTSNGGR